VFNFPQGKEGADSILSGPEESEDEVFGSQPGGRVQALQPLEFPTAPTAPTQPEASAPGTAPTSLNTSAATAPMPPAEVPPSQAATGALSSPFTDLEPVSLPAAFAPAPAPAPQPTAIPQPGPAPAPVHQAVPQPLHPAAAPQPVAPAPAQGNPFEAFDQPSSPASAATEEFDEAPRKRKKRDRDERDRDRDDRDSRDQDRDDRDRPKEKEKEKPARAGYSRDGAKSGGGGGMMMILLILLGGYALLATAAAAYGLFFRSGEKLDTGHPLSTIPDNFGEFDPATRKKVTLYKFPVDGELPPDQRAALGERVNVGQIEIEPRKIEKRKLVVNIEGTSGKTAKRWTDPALVLTMLIKNNSDLSLHPMDPAFTRLSVGDDRPITRVVVSKTATFAGGAIRWPTSGNIKREVEEQQANDYVPLAPGESREYVVFTNSRPDIVNAIMNAKDAIQWRVQVRRDPIQFRGKQVPVTAVIGVDFKASDVREVR
jgi:hypothetical protein